MPRDGAGVYSLPPLTQAVPNTTILSSRYNTFIADISSDLNTPRPIGSGGTGASSASAARSNLGLAIGTDIQAFDADLSQIASISATDNDIIQRKTGAWTNRSMPQLKSDLAITVADVTGAASSGANTNITSVYLDNTGLKIKDTNASHGLIIKPGSDLTADRTYTVTTGDANRTFNLQGGNLSIAGGDVTLNGPSNVTLPSSGTLVFKDGDSASFANTGFSIKDTDASNSLSIVPGSNLTANRTLNIITGDSDRTISMGGNISLAGALTSANNLSFTGGSNLTINTTAPTVATLPAGTVTIVSEASLSFVKIGSSSGAVGVIQIPFTADIYHIIKISGNFSTSASASVNFNISRNGVTSFVTHAYTSGAGVVSSFNWEVCVSRNILSTLKAITFPSGQINVDNTINSPGSTPGADLIQIFLSTGTFTGTDITAYGIRK